MISGPLAVILTLAVPAAALLVAARAFKRRAWRTYRNFGLASCLSSLFTLLVIGYVVFLGRSGGIQEGLTRIRFGLCCGGIQIFAFSVAAISATAGAFLIGRRTDDGRPDSTVGRPMLAVFSVFLLVLLAVVTTAVEIQGRNS